MSNACTWVEPMVTLRTGEQVGSCHERWRFECQARTILNMAGGKVARRELLDAWEKRHGTPSRKALEIEIMALWRASMPTAAA